MRTGRVTNSTVRSTVLADWGRTGTLNADNIFMERLSRRIDGVALGRVCSNTVYNYWPWGRKTKAKNDGFRCPAERLNGKRYADSWLENLLVATSAVPKTRKPPLKTA